jgi:hypothetical protein
LAAVPSSSRRIPNFSALEPLPAHHEHATRQTNP